MFHFLLHSITWVYGTSLQAVSPNFQSETILVYATKGMVSVKRMSAAARFNTKQFVTVLISGNLKVCREM